MQNTKGLIIVGAVLFLGFLYGYRKDSLEAWIEDDAPTATKAEVEAAVAPVVDDPYSPPEPPRVPEPKPAAVKKLTEPPPLSKEQQEAVNQFSPPERGTPSPQNPYAEFEKRFRPKGEMKDTVDSITPGEISDSRREQRNLYFEKLSEQLRELQGDSPQAAGVVEGSDEVVDEKVDGEFIEEDFPEDEYYEEDGFNDYPPQDPYAGFGQ